MFELYHPKKPYAVPCLMQQTLNPGKGGANTTLEIIRDNVSFNDTLLEAFIKHYNKEGMKFQGDIPYIAYILNLII